MSYKIVAALLFMLSLSLVTGGKASAATIIVNTDTNPSTCTLDEAIVNINDQADTNTDCVETGAYGADDTITIPEGTVLLTADLPQITESITIEGAGMGESVIDGDGQYVPFSASNDDATFTFQGLTITAYADSAAIYTDSGDVTVEYVEVDGAGTSFSGSAAGLSLTNAAGTTDNNVVLNNIYAHAFDHDISAINVIGVGTSGAVATSITANNVTVSDISNALQDGAVNGFLVGVGLFGGSPGVEGVSGVVSNVTISNIQADTVGAFSVIAATGGFNNTSSTVTLRNATITKLDSTNQGYAIGVGGAGFLDDDVGAGNLVAENLVLADSDITAACGIRDITGLFGGTGIGTGTITSNGGNLSDDTTCSTYFTEPSDQNNVGNLASTLGTLSDNGGFVPTIPLLENSPAIDAGVDVSGLTTDARLAARPQGNAFDSGAYESPFTREEEEDSGEELASTGRNVSLILLAALGAATFGVALLVGRRRLSK